MTDSILVFTSRSPERLLAEGGSQAWVIDAKRARQCQYLVCSWNETGEFLGEAGMRRHREAFLVAPITSIDSAPAPEDPARYIIRFKQYAEISLPNAWPGQRNPVYYTSLADLGIDPDKLEFKDAPPPSDEFASKAPSPSPLPAPTPAAGGLTIADAKTGLALHYGIAIENIEIVMRG